MFFSHGTPHPNSFKKKKKKTIVFQVKCDQTPILPNLSKNKNHVLDSAE
jgi:hypothetical protein